MSEKKKELAAHSLSAEQTLSALQTSGTTGLTAAEAQQRLDQYGPNRLNQKKKTTLLQRFLNQFKDVMIIILLAAAVISFIIAALGDDAKEFFEPILILVIVILNAVMGVAQESKAEKALDALKSLSAPHARVVRDGKESVIDAAELVPGDVIMLEAGDFVPADARLLTSASLKSEESALTGESVPSEKDADAVIDEKAALGDRANMLYSGCSVTSGRAVAVVTDTGMGTQMGRIAGLLEGEEEGDTPLQRKLAELGKILGYVALAACAVVFVVGLLSKTMTVLETFMTAVALAVSAIPEGLPAVVTIVLSVGVQRMVKRGAIIRALPAVETLGSASVICSDKTGTLTQNKMTLVRAWSDESDDDEAITSENTDSIRKLLRYATLCCDGSVIIAEDGTQTLIGDPTETSIVYAAHLNGMDKDDLAAQSPRLAEIPFDSDRKMMTTICEVDGQLVAITKGAFDSIASRASFGNIEKASALNDEMSRRALRVITVAYRKLSAVPEAPTSEEVEQNLTLLGLVGMIDPPRDEAKAAVAECISAGIRPVMITGDHVVTASAIAQEIGILKEGDRSMTGAQLSELSDEELVDQVEEISVYARVSPEDKIRIVKAWQSKGAIVSMTGDGVNDAPALKAADIGCAMGITGTDVAKGASDMTLTDDNFATIVKAVREGRGIYDNIRKVVGFLLGTNCAEILTVFFVTLIFRISPLLSMQLLWINLVTDSLPALALGMEPVDKDVMLRKPRPKDEGIFAHGLGLRIMLQGVLFAALTIGSFLIGRDVFGKGLDADAALTLGRTMAFITLAMTQCFHSFNMRSNRSLFSIGIGTNKYLNGAFLASVLMMAFVALIPPVAAAFGLACYMPAACYLIALGLAFVPVPVMEFSKRFGLVKHQEG